MKTIEQITQYAEQMAYGHFHCESGEAWEPFENWPEEAIAEETEALADVIAYAMRWAQQEQEENSNDNNTGATP